MTGREQIFVYELYAVRDWSTARYTSLAAAATVTRCSLPSSVRCRLNVISFFPIFLLYTIIFAYICGMCFNILRL